MKNDFDIKASTQSSIKRGRFADTIRQAVQTSYQENGGNLTQAARAHGVSLTSARRWKQHDHATEHDWTLSPPRMQKQRANTLAGHNRESLVDGLLEDYLQLHQDAVEAVKQQVDTPLQRVDALSRLSQALDRTLRALDKASPELSRLHIANWVLERQAEFVKTRFPHYLAVFVEVLEPFGAELVREVNK